MRKTIIALAILLPILAAAQPTIAVINNLGETVQSFHASSYHEFGEPCAIGSSPNQIVYHEIPDGYLMYIICSLSNDVYFLDFGTSVSNVYDLGDGTNPYLGYYHDDKMYVSLWVQGGISIVDLMMDTVTTSGPIGLGPQGICADDDNIYVTLGNLDPITFVYGQGQLVRLNHELEIIDSIAIGMNPQQILDIDGELHIICTGDYFSAWGVSYIVDKESFSVVDSVILGGSPQRLTYQDLGDYGFVYSATSEWGVTGSGRLLAYNAITREVIYDADDTENTVPGLGFTGLDVHGSRIYLPSFDTDELIVLRVADSAAPSVDAIIDVGDGPIDVSHCSPVGIRESPNTGATPSARLAMDAMPNPFNGAVRLITYGIDHAAADVTISDIRGAVVEKFPLSRGDVWRPAGDVPGGAYFVRISDGRTEALGKVMYVK